MLACFKSDFALKKRLEVLLLYLSPAILKYLDAKLGNQTVETLSDLRFVLEEVDKQATKCSLKMLLRPKQMSPNIRQMFHRPDGSSKAPTGAAALSGESIKYCIALVVPLYIALLLNNNVGNNMFCCYCATWLATLLQTNTACLC